MVKSIYLCSPGGSAGKTAVGIGIFLKLRESGLNPGYFKPIGDPYSERVHTKVDKDVNVVMTVVGRRFSPEDICPVFLSEEYFLDEMTLAQVPETTELIMDKFNAIAAQSDIILVEGNHNAREFDCLGLNDVTFAKAFDSDVVIVVSMNGDRDFNETLWLYKHFIAQEVRVAGIIMNNVSEQVRTRVETYYRPILDSVGCPLIGVMPKTRELVSPTVAEVVDSIGAKFLTEDYVLVKNNIIESFLIGAAGVNNALTYLRRGVNQCVITGGDRSDLALAAFEANTKLLVLTGGIEPSPRVLSEAQQRGVPVVLSQNDTFTVAQALGTIKIHIQSNEIQLCRDLVEDHVNWDLVPR
jgi:BioD-like phosphotransacetylase family protein